MLIFTIALTYLLGSINSSVMVCYILNLKSPKKFGSKNAGTTNVLRIAGKRAALITLLSDLLKGIICVEIAKIFYLPNEEVPYVAIALIIGHIFPIFFKFRGGKGVATFTGILMSYCWQIGIFFIAVWVLMFLLSRYSSASSLISIISALVAIIYFFNQAIFIPFSIITVIIFLSHWKNIINILQKREKRVNFF